MRLTKVMKDTILSNTSHLSDGIYGMTTKAMKENALIYMKADISLDSGIEERCRMLEKYPEYCRPSDRIKAWLSDDDSDYTIMSIDKTFAVKYENNGSYWHDICPEFRFSWFSKNTKNEITKYKDRLFCDKEMHKKVEKALNRCTTVKQLLSICPEVSVFFDEDGEFCIPEWKE